MSLVCNRNHPISDHEEFGVAAHLNRHEIAFGFSKNNTTKVALGLSPR